MNRIHPIRLIDIRYAIHCKQIVAQSRMLGMLLAGDLQSEHLKTIGRWASTHSPSSTTTTTIIKPVFENALTYGNKIAIKDEFGEYSYEQIFNGAAKISAEISKICGENRDSAGLDEKFNEILVFQAVLVNVKLLSSVRTQRYTL